MSIATRYELVRPGGLRPAFTVELLDDRVTILLVAGRLVRQVWVGYVRSLCLCDLVDAVPAIAPVVDLVRASIERDDVVRTVRTVYGALSQEVEVVSVVGLLAACAYLGFDGDVGGTPFWKWAEIFPEWLPFGDLDRFRIVLPGRSDDIDHAFLRPAPSRGRGANHPFRCGILSHFPSHDWVRLKDGTRPIPDVVFADGEVERHLARIGVTAHVEGRAAAVAAIGALRPLAAWLVEAPTFEGHELLVRVERGAPYLWMGSIEDSTGSRSRSASSTTPRRRCTARSTATSSTSRSIPTCRGC